MFIDYLKACIIWIHLGMIRIQRSNDPWAYPLFLLLFPWFFVAPLLAMGSGACRQMPVILEKRRQISEEENRRDI